MASLPSINTSVTSPSTCTSTFSSKGPETSLKRQSYFSPVKEMFGMHRVESAVDNEKCSFIESIRKTASCDEFMPSPAEIKALKEKNELKKIYSMPPKMKQKLAPLRSQGAFINSEVLHGVPRLDSWKKTAMEKSGSWKGRPDSAMESICAVAPEGRSRAHELAIEIPARCEGDEVETLMERMISADEYLYSDELGIDEFTPPPLVNRNSSRLSLFVKF